MGHEVWYVSDLDGTLLQPDATLSPWARETLEHVLASGTPFTVASARSMFSIRQILGDLPITLPVVSHNGAVVGELATGRALRVNGFTSAVAAEVMQVIVDQGQRPMITSHTGMSEHLTSEKARNGGHGAFLQSVRTDPRLRIVEDVSVALDEAVIAFTIIGEQGPLDTLRRGLASLQGLEVHAFDDMYEHGWSWVTVHAEQATKAAGLRFIAAQAGLDAAELVVFGDQHNDVSMFSSADRAYAVGDAAPVLQAMATRCLGSNADDAVVRWLVAELTARGVVLG
jgi:Cof subfamily protein (haloacid dehalogenase superfamily)